MEDQKSLKSIKAVAEQLNTSVSSVYRMLADGLEHYDMPGGVKISDEQLQAYLESKKRCLSSVRFDKPSITLPFSEGEAAFIERARQRRRGGARSAKRRTKA